jgi:hypothetical protein
MTEERLSRKNVALSRINEILAKIDEVCDDARMAGVEKVRRIKEEVANAREQLRVLSENWEWRQSQNS